MNPILIIGALLSGFMLGSFLNVAIYRLPRGQSVVKPRSFCPMCHRNIAWHENVPVLSYIILRGRCSGCGKRIPPGYLIIEMTGGILALLCVYRYGLSFDAAFAYSFLMALVAVTLIDWKHRIIPDEISLPFMLLGLVWSFTRRDVTPFSSALGALAGGGGLYAVGAVYKLVRHKEGMGGGDVKLMAMIGAFLGLKLVIPVIVIASFFGSIYGIALLRSEEKGQAEVAFGSFLAPAAAFCMLLGSDVLSWYLGRF